MRTVRLIAFLTMVAWLMLSSAATIYANLSDGAELDTLAVISGLVGVGGLLALLTFTPRRRRR